MTLPTQFDGTAPGQRIRWTTPSEPLDATHWENIVIQVVGTPGVPYAAEVSFDGETYEACDVIDPDGDLVPTLDAAGFYILDAGGVFLQMSAGSGAELNVRVGD